MWYYILNGEKVGPVAATTIILLFQKGVIKLNTQIWNPNLKIWSTFEESEVYYKHQNPKDSSEQDSFKSATKKLRPFIIVTIVCLIYRLLFFSETLEHLEAIQMLNPVTDNLKIVVAVAQNAMMFNLITAILITLLISIIIYAIRWLYASIDIARITNGAYPYNRYYAWSVLIPVVNLYYPIKIVWATLNTAKKGSRLKASAIINFITWCFFWILAIILFCIECSGMLIHKQFEQIPLIISTRFLITSVYIAMLFFSLVQVTTIFRLQFKKKTKK